MPQLAVSAVGNVLNCSSNNPEVTMTTGKSEQMLETRPEVQPGRSCGPLSVFPALSGGSLCGLGGCSELGN